jgi:hypothetical protein
MEMKTKLRMVCHVGRSAAALIVAVLGAGFFPQPISAQERPRAVGHAPTRIVAHYMPWFEARPYSPHWGWHWTMDTFDPDDRKSGKPTLASHYRPLIGPYDSGDPDVLEYHAILMRLAGIDGVILDWYGTVDFLDYRRNHRNVMALAEQAAKSGLEFAVCYEDQTIPKLVEDGRIEADNRVEHARREIGWLRANWFSKHSYLKLDGRPVLLSFGRSGLTDTEWEGVLADRADALIYFSEHERRRAAAGAFDWPSPRVGRKAQDSFYEKEQLSSRPSSSATATWKLSSDSAGNSSSRISGAMQRTCASRIAFTG